MIQYRNWLLSLIRPFRYAWDYATYRGEVKAGYSFFRDANKHATALIVANGPSLNNTPLDLLAENSALTIGLNKIHLYYANTNWRPDFVVTINGLISKQSANDIARENKIVVSPWKNRYFFSKKHKEKVKFFPMKYKKSFSLDSEILGGTSTVTATALQLLYHMGVKNVIIVGMDHNYAESAKENMIIKMNGKDRSHFSDNYFESGTLWGAPDIRGSEEDYHSARLAFEQIGGNIWDATIDGKCQVFKKITIENALNLLRSQA